MTLTLSSFQDRGACRDQDPELFFPISETEAKAEQIAQAKAVCESCPVFLDCRAFALTTPVEGIWGGMTESERRNVRARRATVAAKAVADQADIGEDTPAESSPPLPSYESARQQLARARRHLARVQQTSAAAVTRAEQRVEAAEKQFEAVRTRSTTVAVA